VLHDPCLDAVDAVFGSVPGPAYTRTISAALRPGSSSSTRYWCSLNVDQIKTRFKKTVREECERRGVDRS
jgi:hypothetical protein